MENNEEYYTGFIKEWKEYFSDEYKRPYWYNEKIKKSTYISPEYILKLLIINKFVDNPSNKPLFWDATQDYRNIMITFSKGQKHLFDYKTMQICKPLSSNSEDIINPNLNLYENLVKSDHSPIESHNRIQTDHINILKNYDKKTDEFKEKALSSSTDDSKKYNWEEYKEKYLEKIIQFNVDF